MFQRRREVRRGRYGKTRKGRQRQQTVSLKDNRIHSLEVAKKAGGETEVVKEVEKRNWKEKEGAKRCRKEMEVETLR